MLASECKCCVCGKQAYAFWPCIDPDIHSNAYCEKHLREAQMQVITDMFGEAEGKRLYKEYKKQKGE